MADDPLGLAQPPKVQVPAADTPKPEALFGLVTGVVVVCALYLARDVLIPITLAVVLSFFLAPIVKLLQRARLPKVAAVIVTVLAALAVILLVGAIIASQIKSLVGNLPQYVSTVNDKIEWGHRAINTLVTQVTSRLGTLHQLAAPAPGSVSGAAQEEAPIPVILASSSTSYLETARLILEPILSPLATLAIVIIVTIFILIRQEDLRDRLIRLFGSNDLHRTTLAIDDATRRLTRYFLTQAAINICFGIFVGVGLFFIGLPSPVLWGLLAALLQFVPYVGSITAALLPIALAAAVDPGWSIALWTAGLFILAEGVTGQFLEPVLYGSSTGLSPTAVVIVAIFWSWIWGPIGLILSTPLTLCLVVVGRHVRHLEFFDVLLGDRPALTPVETLYQRLLAGDPDEILEQADTLLKGRALSSYYDDIALKALRLVARDTSRGVVQPAQLVKIQEAMLALILDLESHDDVDPVLTKAQAKAAVVEVAGVARPERETATASAGGTSPRGFKSPRYLAHRTKRAVHPWPRTPRRSRGGDAGAVAAQAWTWRAGGAQRRGFEVGDQPSRHDRRGDGVRHLCRAHRQPPAYALPLASGETEVSPLSDPGRVLGSGRHVASGSLGAGIDRRN